ncbi:8-oxo-dGTP diphosphatase [Anaerovibrio lipolyticus DSM 3074]|uniref:8-oxo-dGTP diphosphatase n=2 Tax=Anaerovibrio lipolyticus TaxID=82374 RepID=A0A0B2K347_9FIRM|nr:(deoxy)nucleoside triphosphate pyrophosphohydrolase [Anaerovibrio lipolyticus]KHM52567.1 DNA mismatch repair protein MutT [Anaerovibrio lipolyticus]SHI58430.1 8-oxo-dGTP diphosphatase [Anaerovibrio lipolyticus DSM 3074]
MKTINVVAAVIRKGDKILATQRGYGEFKDGWEFPGGKIEPGERPEEALKREIKEELKAAISVGEDLGVVEYDYPNFHLNMRCFMCSLVSEDVTLLEHEAMKWLTAETIDTVNWLPADKPMTEKIKEILRG